MFVGHIALAFAARRKSGDLSLGWLVAGVTALDLVWPVFLLAGVETVRIVPGATAFNPLVFDSYPWSHSLTMAVAWGLVLAGLVWGIRGSSPLLLLTTLVLSHWFLDAVSHAPDMPLWPGPSPRVGLELWRSIPATYLVEGAMWVTGLALYTRDRRARTRGARVALWSLVALCTVMWASAPWGPPPPSPRALGWFAMSGWLIPFWAHMADRGHEPRAPA